MAKKLLGCGMDGIDVFDAGFESFAKNDRARIHEVLGRGTGNNDGLGSHERADLFEWFGGGCWREIWKRTTAGNTHNTIKSPHLAIDGNSGVDFDLINDVLGIFGIAGVVGNELLEIVESWNKNGVIKMLLGATGFAFAELGNWKFADCMLISGLILEESWNEELGIVGLHLFFEIFNNGATKAITNSGTKEGILVSGNKHLCAKVATHLHHLNKKNAVKFIGGIGAKA